ncbi:N-acetylmuramoyl-L-alanine amidase [Streptosporangium roseum]|uniref:N-acetylmuramoyl-L-alanine amidase n=1 Tax=Streptosporangium roseum TaxID=2001 RepID=UPI003326CAB9
MRRLPAVAVLALVAALAPPAAAVPAPDGGRTESGQAPPTRTAPAHGTPGKGPAASAPPYGTSESRQAAFARAARTYGVPESVLLAVSYLESRWDANDGLPSVSAGYGPMHLVDGRTGPGRHRHGGEDPRGDESRPRPPVVPEPAAPPPEDTLRRAAELTGIAPGRLRRDPVANIRGGAALLADHQRRTGERPSTDPARWYGAVARYPGTKDAGAATSFADEVYATIRTGVARVTDDGERVVLPAIPDLSPRRPPAPSGLLRAPAPAAAGPDCPPTVSCEWMPAAYRRLKNGDYGNHDRYDGPRRIDYIVIHDGESSYDAITRLTRNPTYLSWHFTLRSADGHIAQHLRGSDIGWHAGNWYVNTRSIGLEHEGYLAKGGTWYTEAMYRSSAALVAHLARKYGVPLNRAHIIGHDNVPGTTPEGVRGMHQDPGPYWDWAHYFELLGSPLTGSADPGSRSVLIRPDYALNQPRFTGCAKSGECPPQGASSVWLHSRPSEEAPLVKDIGKHPTGASNYGVYDHAARASTGQRYALAERRGDWTAIWYLGQKAWFHDPETARTSVPAAGRLVTPRPGRAPVKVYGRAYPEASAYPRGVPRQELIPLQYSLPAGQFYSLGMTSRATYLRAGALDPSRNRVVRGDVRYHQIQFGHRIMFVRAADVKVVPQEDPR